MIVEWNVKVCIKKYQKVLLRQWMTTWHGLQWAPFCKHVPLESVFKKWNLLLMDILRWSHPWLSKLISCGIEWDVYLAPHHKIHMHLSWHMWRAISWLSLHLHYLSLWHAQHGLHEETVMSQFAGFKMNAWPKRAKQNGLLAAIKHVQYHQNE